MKEDSADKLAGMIGEIDAFDRAECLDSWRKTFGRPPPKYLSAQFMKRVLIWEMHSRALGGASTKPARRLQEISSGGTVLESAKPSSHLVREWNVERIRSK